MYVQLSRASLLVAALSVLAVGSLEQTRDGLDECLQRLQGPDRAAFLLFDRELKSAIEKRDPVSLALLVDFPLRVNERDLSTVLLANPAALQSRFATVFSASVRRDILNQKTNDLICGDDGISFGSGTVWIRPVGEGAASHYALIAVKVDSNPSDPLLLPSQTQFACNADKHRVLVDTVSNGTIRYRSWNRPRSILDPPDLELTGGRLGYEGSGVCVRRLWKFNSAGTEFIVGEEDRCAGPAGSHGTLEVVNNDRTRLRSECY